MLYIIKQPKLAYLIYKNKPQPLTVKIIICTKTSILFYEKHIVYTKFHLTELHHENPNPTY